MKRLPFTPQSQGFTEIFIRRAVATTLVMAAIVLFGVVAYRALPVSDLPNIEMPTLVISASLVDVYSFVGLILLVGIVKKNAIMQIDFALDAERRLGLSPREAIFQGCVTRFRPIMMTTMAALLGTAHFASRSLPGSDRLPVYSTEEEAFAPTGD